MRCKPLRQVLRRFGGDGAGAAAIEFALVLPMLFAIVLSTVEAGWTMTQSIMLDRALDTTIRELRLGHISNPTHDVVRNQVCDRALVLAACRTTLALEMIPITSAASYPADTARCVDRGSTIQPVLRFNVGARSQRVFVRACFVVEPLTPGLGLGLALPKDATGAYRLIARSAFVNEPV